MPKLPFLCSLLFAAVGVAGDASGKADAAPDLILHNGTIFTGDPAQPRAQALAIRGERIVAVGDDEAIAALAGVDTRRIDLDGRRVVPGINDAHEHLGWHPPEGTLLTLAWPEPTGADLDAALKAQPADGEGWIRGEIGAGVFNDPDWNIARLDALHPSRPVLLWMFTSHGLLLNTAAQRALGVDPAIEIPGGWYGRDAGGTFDGRLYEYAPWRVMTRRPLPSDDAALEQLRQYGDEVLKLGITSVQTMAWIPPAQFVALWRRSGAPQRVRVIRFPMQGTPDQPIDGADLPRQVAGAPKIEVSGTKWILDGTPVDQNAALRLPYPGSDREGRLNFAPTRIEALVREILARDDQPMLHVSGDATAAAVFDALEAIAPPAEWRARRVRLEHGDGLAPDLLGRAAGFGIVVVQNPSHFMVADDHPFAVLVRERDFQPLSGLLDAGIALALGSDGPRNPWLNLQFAAAPATRPDQALTREQALRAYTEGSAFAEFREHEKGRLAPGYLADLAVLSQDVLDEAAVPLQELPKTVSMLTVIGGEIVWRDPAF